MRKCFQQGKHLLTKTIEHHFFCVPVPEVSGLRTQVFVHSIQGSHATIFL